MIIGIGVDIIEVAKIARHIEREHYLCKIFTPSEVAGCEARVDTAECFAGKFAVKEAFMKAIGSGIRQGVWFIQIEVLNRTTGQPYARASGQAKKVLEILGVTRIHVSLSHSAGMAIGCVVLEG